MSVGFYRINKGDLHILYTAVCKLVVIVNGSWFMLDSVVSTVDTVWLTLAIHGFSVLRNHYHMSLRAYSLIPIPSLLVVMGDT